MDPSFPPSTPAVHYNGQKPQVVTWYYVYVVVLCLMFLAVIVGAALVLAGVFPIPEEEQTDATVVSLIYLIMGGFILIPCLVAFFLPRRKWVWIYHMVLICLGLTGCTVVGCIPLLIFWLKPEVKAYFDE